MNFEEIFFILEIIGTVAFAASGAITAIDKNMDIFGTVFLGAVAALGGGVVRDLLVGNLPPAMFSDYSYLSTAAVCALIIFLIVLFGKFELKNKTSQWIIDVFDAVGLGVFTVTGINTGIKFGFGDNLFFIIFLGMTTGIGGGMIRDVLVKEIPFVLRKRVYAVASLLGGILYCVLLNFKVNSVYGAVAAICFIFIIRILSAVFKIDLPHPKKEAK